MNTVISVENLSKSYQLGAINTGTFRGDLQRWWARTRGLPDPHLKIGEKDHGNRNGETLWALKDVSFSVQQGEALGIIGRNGAGKSTLLKILSRVTAPTSGEVKVKGRIASLLEVGTGFHPELTGRENIYLNGAILGMNKAEISRKFDEIVDFSGVEKFIDTPVKRYSSGMYVRLAFAVAAHLDPEILIVDEVLSVGDAEFQKKCLGKMGEEAKGGRTVLFVSHNMGAIQQLCYRVILINAGVVASDGMASEVVRQYLSLGKNQNHEIVWAEIDHAPGDEIVRLALAQVCGKDGVGRNTFTVREDIQINLKYKVLRDCHLEVYVYLMNEAGTCVLVSIDNNDSPWRDCERPKGVYESRCYIPGDFLNAGDFYMNVVVSDNHRRIMHLEAKNAISFSVHDSMDSEGVRGNYPYSWPQSVVRPRLKWVVERAE